MIKVFFFHFILVSCFCAIADNSPRLTVTEFSGKKTTPKKVSGQESKPSEKKMLIRKKDLSSQEVSSFEQEELSEMEVDESIIESDLTSDFPDSQRTHGIEAFWKTVFKLRAFSDRSTTDAMVSTEIYGKLKWQVMDFLSFHNQSLIIGRSGFTSSIYERSDRRSGLHLVESYFDLETSFLTFRFGNVNQDFLKAPLLITDKTFPSLIQFISFDLQDKSKLAIFLQQAMTDNAVESVRRESQIIKGVPLFFTSSFFLDLNDFMGLNIAENFTLFYMTNLSPAIADQSRIYGNTIDFMKSDSRFRFKFFGFYNSLNFHKTLFGDWIFETGGDIIHNFSAPDTYNQGERLYSSLYHNYKGFAELKLTLEYFANQSDTSVAYFNSELYGHNNREGSRLIFQSHFYSSGLTLGLSWTRSWPINEERSATGFSSAIAFFLTSNYVPI